MKRKARKLRIREVPQGPVHPGIELYEQLLERIKKRESYEGSLVYPEGFFSLLDVLQKESDEMDALSWYGQLAEWFEGAISRDRHRSRESLRKFLEGRT